MKKITFLSFLLMSFVLSTGTIAQTLNQNAGWPNTNWTVTGTYSVAAGAFEANPTVDANFAYDDDDAGNPSDDNIAAESPVIDVTAAFTAGETWLTVTADYVYFYLANDELLFQYWDADGALWVNWGPSFDTLGTTTTLTDDFCSGTPSTYISPVLDIAGFTATQQSGFRYRISYDDNPDGTDWNYGFCFQSPTITSSTPPTDLLDYYNLQFPATGAINAGDTFDVFAQAYEPGLTDATAGQAPGIEAWIGYSTTDTNPNGASWTWVMATFNVEVGDNDEYSLNLGSAIPGIGTYYYASRWRLNGGVYTYGGIQADESYGGVWGEDNNISGVLTIAGPANDECSGAISLTVNADLACGVVTSSTTLGATASPQPDDATGTPNNDVWFSFVATSATHQIVISNVVNLGGGTSTSTDMGMSVFNDLAGCSMVAANEVGESDPNTLNLAGLTSGNLYYVRVYGWFATIQNNNFDICVGTPPPPPSNDACSGANVITSIPYDFSQTDGGGSTNNNGFITACTTGAGGMNDGLWFTFTPSTNGTVDIAVSNVAAGFDPQLDLYSGSCGTFTCIANVDVGGGAGSETITAQAVTAGTQYFINVGNFSGITNNPEGNFDISVTGTFTLSLAEFENANAFTYFPNPVKNILTLRAQSTIQNVFIYNMLGQEVVRTAPNTLESEISMNQLQSGAYFVKVSINDTTETIRVIKQ